MRFLSSLQTPAVRALAWSCFTRPILNHIDCDNGTSIAAPRFALTPERRRWLLALDHNPAPLLEHLRSRCHSPRLGLVFESLWHFFLIEDPETELIGHNLSVRRGNRSLGEFDIIYRCHQRQQDHHLELAVKFYLASQPPQTGNPLSTWLGPDRRDRLDIKLVRLGNHQLRLAETPEGSALLNQLGVYKPTPQLLMNGFLFHRWGIARELQPELSKRHQAGYWIEQRCFTRQLAPHYPHWYQLEKPHWLAGLAAAKPLAPAALMDTPLRRPLMLIASSADKPGEEALRVFVTPDGWPGEI